MDLMIDLETLGTSPKAPVISIGACYFDKTGVKQHFYAVLDVKEQIDSGLRKVDADTIKWWMDQEGAAKKVFKEELGVIHGRHIHDFLSDEDDDSERVRKLKKDGNTASLLSFIYFCAGEYKDEDTKPWGNGSTFDITILESLLKDFKIVVPWKFYNIRDYRTFKEYVYDGKDLERTGTHHNALDDAIYQAEVVVEGMNRNKNNKSYAPKPLSVRQSFSVFLADFKASLSK